MTESSYRIRGYKVQWSWIIEMRKMTESCFNEKETCLLDSNMLSTNGISTLIEKRLVRGKGGKMNEKPQTGSEIFSHNSGELKVAKDWLCITWADITSVETVLCQSPNIESSSNRIHLQADREPSLCFNWSI